MYIYRLENGIVLNSERMVDAILSETDFPELYFDKEVGALVEIPSKESLIKWVEEIGTTNRYLHIERLSDDERIDHAHEFINIFLRTDLKNKELKEVRKALTEGGRLGFEDFLVSRTDGWIHGWNQYIEDIAWEYVHEWLTKNPFVKITSEFIGCEGCVICEAMKNGELNNFQSLQEAFTTESLMQQVVGEIARHKKNSTENRLPIPSESPTKGISTAKRITTDKVFVFKITLNESKPNIWRRIVVPSNYTFFEFHSVINDAMGWEDNHFHSFKFDSSVKSGGTKKSRLEKMIIIESPNEEFSAFDTEVDARNEFHEYLFDWFGKEYQKCDYLYDFGDNWEHTVLLEKVLPLKISENYPQCIGGKNACPPENCGGVLGYEHIKDVLKTPNHEEHSDILEWLSLREASEFNPSEFNPREVVFMTRTQK